MHINILQVIAIASQATVLAGELSGKVSSAALEAAAQQVVEDACTDFPAISATLHADPAKLQRVVGKVVSLAEEFIHLPGDAPAAPAAQ